jgi:hypothetical protein
MQKVRREIVHEKSNYNYCCTGTRVRSLISRSVYTTSPADLGCDDVSYRNFELLSQDPHRFDRNDHDGIGCES